MACSQCSSDEVVRFAYFDSPRSLCVCEGCGFSHEVDGEPPLGGDGRTADGCMDEVHSVSPPSEPAGPSQGVSAGGNSNRIIGLLRDPHKGVM